MRVFKDVRGTQPNRPLELEVDIDTVYVRENITRVEEEDFTGWQYDETQYELKEYIELIGNENIKLHKEIDSTSAALYELMMHVLTT